jgi:hypothetical protein
LMVAVSSKGELKDQQVFPDQPPFTGVASYIIRSLRQSPSVRIRLAKGSHMNHIPELRHDKDAGEILCIQCGVVFKEKTYGQLDGSHRTR